MQSSPVTRVALYVRDLERVASFYEAHFGFRRHVAAADKIILFPQSGGCAIVLLQASRGQRVGQSSVKIVFDVSDVRTFRASRVKAGLKFGVVHRGPGYEFANARDPAKNLIQISDAHLRDPQTANKAPEPTPTSVMPRANEPELEMKRRTEKRIPARVMPAAGVAHL